MPSLGVYPGFHGGSSQGRSQEFLKSVPGGLVERKSPSGVASLGKPKQNVNLMHTVFNVSPATKIWDSMERDRVHTVFFVHTRNSNKSTKMQSVVRQGV